MSSEALPRIFKTESIVNNLGYISITVNYTPNPGSNFSPSYLTTSTEFTQFHKLNIHGRCGVTNCYDLDLSFFYNFLLKSPIGGCYCHHDYCMPIDYIQMTCQLVLSNILILKKINKLQNVEACLHCIAS